MNTFNYGGAVATGLTLSLLTGIHTFMPRENTEFIINSQKDREIKVVITSESEFQPRNYEGECGNKVYINKSNKHHLRIEEASNYVITVTSITRKADPTILIKSWDESITKCYNKQALFRESYGDELRPGDYSIWVGNKQVNGDIYEVEIKKW